MLSKSHSEDILVDWCQIAKRPPGSGHPNITDDYSEETVLTSASLFERNFTGGETYFVDDMAVHPKTKNIIF